VNSFNDMKKFKNVFMYILSIGILGMVLSRICGVTIKNSTSILSILIGLFTILFFFDSIKSKNRSKKQ